MFRTKCSHRERSEHAELPAEQCSHRAQILTTLCSARNPETLCYAQKLLGSRYRGHKTASAALLRKIACTTLRPRHILYSRRQKKLAMPPPLNLEGRIDYGHAYPLRFYVLRLHFAFIRPGRTNDKMQPTYEYYLDQRIDVNCKP